MRLTRRSILSTLAGAAATAALRPRLSVALADSSETTSSSETQDQPLPHNPLRPAFHYLPARNWMNDPCAPIFHRGQYHMFHQYNPSAAVWGDMHWAHAVSPDMVHWKRLPVAIAPTPGGPDSEGVFTGSSILHHGTPAIIYTGVQSVPHDQATLSDGAHNFRETQLLATSSTPDLGAWTKRSQPVIPTPPPGMKVTGFRDPAPFEHAGVQYLVVGSGQRGVGGMALLYRAASPDLTQWEYLHPLAESTTFSPNPTTRNPTKSTPVDTPKDPVDTGEMWECPDFFALNNRHVLIYSTQRKTFWQVGDLDPASLRFRASTTGQLDSGSSFYAPKTQLDAHGNRILWGWVAEKRTDAEMTAAGWSGMLSLPRVLTLRDGRLLMDPLPALQQLRRSSFGSAINEYTAILSRHEPEPVWEQSNGPVIRRDLSPRDSAGPLLEIRPTTATSGPQQPHVRGQTQLLITGPDRLLVSLNIDPLLDSAELHVFVDNSVLELFFAGQCFTYRFYHRAPGAPILTLNLPPGLFLTHASTYTLNPIWPA